MPSNPHPVTRAGHVLDPTWLCNAASHMLQTGGGAGGNSAPNLAKQASYMGATPDRSAVRTYVLCRQQGATSGTVGGSGVPKLAKQRARVAESELETAREEIRVLRTRLQVTAL